MGVLRTAAHGYAAALAGSAASARLGWGTRAAVKSCAATVGDHAARAALRCARGAGTTALIDGAAASTRVWRRATPAIENFATAIGDLAALGADVGARFRVARARSALVG